MPCKNSQSKMFARVLTRCNPFAIRRALCFACVWVSLSLCFSPVASRADDLLEDVSPRVAFDAETMTAVSNLALSLSDSKATSLTVEQIAQNIYDLMYRAYSPQGNYSAVRTVPFSALGTTTVPLGSILSATLSEQTGPLSVLPQNSRLYKIQYAIAGDSDVHSTDALLPTLLRVESLLSVLTNRTDSVDLGPVTNLLASIERVQSAIALNTNALYAGNGASVGYNLGNVSDFLLYDFAPVAGNLGDFLLSSPNGWDDFFDMVYLASQDTDQAFIPGQRAFRVSDTNTQALLSDIASAIQDLSSSVDDVGDLVGTGLGIDQNGSSISDSLAAIEKDLIVIESYLGSIADYTHDIHYNDLDYAQTSRSVQKDFAELFDEMGYSTTPMRSVQQDFRFLQQQIGVEYPTASNSIAGILGRLFYSGEDAGYLDEATNVVAEGEASGVVATNVMASSETDAANVLRTNELDWAANEYSSTSPYSEIANLGTSAGSQFANALPDLPDATDRTLVLFRGNFPIFGGSQSRSRAGSLVAASSVNLDVSYPLADYDAVSNGLSTMNGIMSTIWDIIGVILIAWMYKRFYDDVSSGRFEGSIG